MAINLNEPTCQQNVNEMQKTKIIKKPTVYELIKMLSHYPPEMEVRTETPPYGHYRSITRLFVRTENDGATFLEIGNEVPIL